MSRLFQKIPLLTLFLIVPAFAGCGDSNVVTVSGTLTYKGKPVTNAYVNFVPEKGRPSTGETDANGHFTLSYDPKTKGAERGKHRVFVMWNEFATAAAKDVIPGMPAKIPNDMKEFFNKYGGENSKVEVTLSKSVSDLKLEWE